MASRHRAHPHAVRSHDHGSARPAVRRAWLPGRGAELPGDVRIRGEFVPVRNEQVDGKATLDWVAAQPWFDGRLVMWGASYLGMTQWAVAQDAPDFLQALSLQVTAANFRDSVVFPGGAFALETGLAWLHEIKNQELGWRTVLRSHLGGGPSGEGVERGPAAREVRQRGHRRAHGLLPGMARARHPGRPVVGRRSTSGAGSTTCRRPASSAAGTTSSCGRRWTTTRRCGAPVARPG